MKKSVAAYLVFAFSLGLVFTSNLADAKAQVFSLSPTLRSISFDLTTPEAIARFMWKNFTFENDQRIFGKEEHWQAPEEFLANKQGDCEDFALFAKAMLKRAGIQSFLLNVYGDGFAHTVCVFKEDGKYHIIDGTDVKRLNAESIEDLSEKIHTFWTSASIVDLSKEHNAGRVLKTFHRA